MQLASSPYSLYIHIPWCIEKCPYCDFNSHAIKRPVDESAYLEALLDDFSQEREFVSKRTLSTIFIGGGTPSTLSASFYNELLSRIMQLTETGQSLEITLEANPGTVDAANFAGYKAAGINRLSMGFQSLQDEKLMALGRIHDAKQAIEAFYMARSAGFDNINIDLMFALPDQSPDEALEDLKQATALKPEHLSWYQLTLEPNTAFFASPPSGIPDDDDVWEIQQAGQQWLQQHDYGQYEISAYCRPDRQCQHNLNYWHFGDYVGIGAGAHGKITLPEYRIIRRTKQRHPNIYLNGNYLSQQTELSGHDLCLEFMMNNLRLNKGFNQSDFETTTGQALTTIQQRLAQAVKRKLLVQQDDRFLPTDLGFRYLNDLLTIFV